MKIQIKFLANYREHLPDQSTGDLVEIQIPEQTTVQEVVAQFGLPFPPESVVLINGKTCTLDQQLIDGDTLFAFPAMAGG